MGEIGSNDISQHSDLRLSLDSRFLAHRESKESDRVDVIRIETSSAKSTLSISKIRHFVWAETSSRESRDDGDSKSVLVCTTLSNDVIIRDPSESEPSSKILLTSSEISKRLGGDFKIVLLSIDPRIHDAFSTRVRNDECILIVDTGNLAAIRFSAETFRIESVTYLLGLRIPHTRYEFPHLLPEDYHEDEIEYEDCPKILIHTICLTRDYIFALDSETRKRIHAWDISTGHLRARVHSQDEIRDVSISSDSTWIAMLNLRRNICVVNLDKYFEMFPCDFNRESLLCESREDDDDDDNDDFEEQVLEEDDEFDLNGFNITSFLSQEEVEEKTSSVKEKITTSTARSLMKHLDENANFSFLDNNTLLVRSSHKIHVYNLVDKQSWRCTVHTHQTILLTHNSSFLLLDNSGLFSVFPSKSRLLEEILLFSTIETAEELSELNDSTSSSEIPLLALRLGLRYQEVNLIKKSLKRLRGELRHDGRKLIMEYLCRHWFKSEDREMFNRLLHIAERFVISLIDSETERLSRNEKESKAFAELMTTKRETLLAQLSDDLNRLRTIWFYLNKGEDEVAPTPLPVPVATPAPASFLSVQSPKSTRRSLILPLNNQQQPLMFFDWSALSLNAKLEDTRRSSSSENEDPILESLSVMDIGDRIQIAKLARDINIARRRFFKLFRRWRPLRDVDVVRDALILRLVPTALSYLTLRSQVRRMRENSSLPSNAEFLKYKLQSPSIVMELSPKEQEEEKRDISEDTWFERTFSFVAPSHVNMEEIPGFVYERFKEIAEYHIYNLLCNGVSGADTRSFSNNRICFRDTCNTLIFESAALLRMCSLDLNSYPLPPSLSLPLSFSLSLSLSLSHTHTHTQVRSDATSAHSYERSRIVPA